MDNTALYMSAVTFAVVFGIVATIIYYFARYYIRMSPDDPEVVSALKKKPVITAGSTSLTEALSQTRSGFWNKLNPAQAGFNVDQLEEALFTSDIGAQTAQKLFLALSEKLPQDAMNEQGVRMALRSAMMDLLQTSKPTLDLFSDFNNKSEMPQPLVWMVVGVNGAGKTTTIGKLAWKAKDLGLKVLIVAGDTYRAAADAQLAAWAERSGAVIHSPEGVKDPAAVAFSSLEFAKSQKFDLVIVDTAGRLHTQSHLMDELQKVKRVMAKVIPEAPHQTLIVLDANSGQNAQLQAKHFNDALTLTGVILTKMDGTAKGGVVLGIVDELGLPVPLIGVGEAVEDLRPFSAKEFVESIV